MTDERHFEDRLRATFQAEGAELTRRQKRASSGSDDGMRAAALVDAVEGDGSDWDRRMVVPLLAAAVLLVAGIAGAIALARPNVDAPTELTTASSQGPSPLVTATPTLTAEEEPFFHTVQPGDLLSEIAARYNVRPDVLIRANPHVDPNVLFVGERLRIPGAITVAGELPASTAVPALPPRVVPSEPPPPTPVVAQPVTPTEAPTPAATPRPTPAWCR